MQNRRKFLFQTSMATASLAILKHLQSVALAPAKGFNAANKISIIDTRYIHYNGDTSHINFMALNTLKKTLQNNECHLLLLGTGNLLQAKGLSREEHLKKFNALHKVGLDANLPGQLDVEKRDEYYNSLTNDCDRPLFSSDNKKAIDLMPFQIIKKGKIKVGIIGNNNFKKQNSDSRDLIDLATWVNRTAAYLKENGNCNLILLMRNGPGQEEKINGQLDITLAGMTKNVNMIASSCKASKNCDSYIAQNLDAQEVFISFATNDSSLGSRFEITFNDKLEKINTSVYAVA